MDYKEVSRSRKGNSLVLAVLNQKGGVGKSTTSINLSAALGEAGQKVLIVDLDPQGNTTSGYGIEKSTLSKCVYDALVNDVAIEELMLKTCTDGVYIVPATIQLTGAELELVTAVAREARLTDALKPVRELFDYVIIDCPPSLGLLTINALTAADEVFIPIQCEFYALEGVSKLLDSMKLVKSRLNPDLDVFGVLMTMYDSRTSLSRQVVEEVHRYFGDKMFETLIPRTVKLSEAPSYGIPINQYDPSGKGAKAYDALAEEVMQRVQ